MSRDSTADPDPDPWEELADLAEKLARQAGQLIVATADTARRETATKSSATDLVTAADTAAERLIVEGIVAHRPDDAIEGEEGASRRGSNEVVWHVDPIDGTTNYVYAIPAFCVSIAAAIRGELVAGVVFDPSRDRLFRAVKGKGARCGHQPLTCSTSSDPATALVATGFGYDARQRQHQAEVLVAVLPEIRDIRRFGSAALDLCAVATGEVDAYYERGLNRWDLAAGSLIASEAGATVGNLRGGPPDEGFVLASGRALFDPLRGLLRSAGADQGP